MLFFFGIASHPCNNVENNINALKHDWSYKDLMELRQILEMRYALEKARNKDQEEATKTG
jgi:hypothetical protein